MKSSSRAGRFKKKLVSADQLLTEASVIEERLAPIKTWLEQKNISEAEFTALSLVNTLAYRFPKTWLGAKSFSGLNPSMPFPLQDLPWTFEENIQHRLRDVGNLGELFSNFALRSTPLAVNRALLKWAEGHYALKLYFRILSPLEVLKLQREGERCVTVLTKKAELERFVLGERDHLSFTMHDLIHADHFYHENKFTQGQIGFYNLLARSIEAGHFDELLPNKEFAAELDYLISDMNAYPIHLLKCLKAAIEHYQSQSKFDEWTERLGASPEVALALRVLNTKDYQAEVSDPKLLDFLDPLPHPRRIEDLKFGAEVDR